MEKQLQEDSRVRPERERESFESATDETKNELEANVKFGGGGDGQSYNNKEIEEEEEEEYSAERLL